MNSMYNQQPWWCILQYSDRSQRELIGAGYKKVQGGSRSNMESDLRRRGRAIEADQHLTVPQHPVLRLGDVVFQGCVHTGAGIPALHGHGCCCRKLSAGFSH